MGTQFFVETEMASLVEKVEIVRAQKRHTVADGIPGSTALGLAHSLFL
jgi:hypothetical protein